MGSSLRLSEQVQHSHFCNENYYTKGAGVLQGREMNKRKALGTTVSMRGPAVLFPIVSGFSCGQVLEPGRELEGKTGWKGKESKGRTPEHPVSGLSKEERAQFRPGNRLCVTQWREEITSVNTTVRVDTGVMAEPCYGALF